MPYITLMGAGSTVFARQLMTDILQIDGLDEGCFALVDIDAGRLELAQQIAEKLMRDGLAPDMPMAVIENGARPTMRVLRGPLAALPELVEREQVKSPALIVIGEVTAREDATIAASGMALLAPGRTRARK